MYSDLPIWPYKQWYVILLSNLKMRQVRMVRTDFHAYAKTLVILIVTDTIFE